MVVLNSSSDLRILVTGGPGFIGSHVVDRLVEMSKCIIDKIFSGIIDSLNNSMFSNEALQ